MKKKIGIALTAMTLGFSSPAILADETGAGCGIGKVLLEGKSDVSSNIVAAIINDILIPRTFFMTTANFAGEAILGCDPTQTVMRDEEKAVFVASNKDLLSQDIAQGQGAHLEALAIVMGIDDEADRQAFFSMTQEEYATLFPETEQEASDILASLNDAMMQRPELAKYIQ